MVASKRPPLPKPWARLAERVCMRLHGTQCGAGRVSSEALAAPGTARPEPHARPGLKRWGGQEGLLCSSPHPSFPVSHAEVPLDLRQPDWPPLYEPVGTGSDEPSTALSRTHVFACTPRSRVSPPHLVALTTAPLVPRVHSAQVSPLKRGPRPVEEGKHHFGPLPTSGPSLFHLPRPRTY